MPRIVSRPGTINSKIVNLTTGATTSFGAGFISGNDSKAPTVSNINGRIITKLYIDLEGNTSKNTIKDIIGNDSGGAAYIYRHVNSINGMVSNIYMTCIETPTTGDDDIDLVGSTAGTGAYDTDYSTLASGGMILEAGAGWEIGVTRELPTGAANGASSQMNMNNFYLYLASGNGDTAGEYGAGKFIITIVGQETF